MIKKLSFSNSIIFILNGDFFIITSLELLKVVILESKDIKNSFSLPLTLILISVLSGIINGLAFKLCGAIGFIIRFSASGIIIGPPQLKEYPVEPVGVEIISPSAQ